MGGIVMYSVPLSSLCADDVCSSFVSLGRQKTDWKCNATSRECRLRTKIFFKHQANILSRWHRQKNIAYTYTHTYVEGHFSIQFDIKNYTNENSRSSLRRITKRYVHRMVDWCPYYRSFVAFLYILQKQIKYKLALAENFKGNGNTTKLLHALSDSTKNVMSHLA